MVPTKRYDLCGGFSGDVTYCDELSVMINGSTHTVSVELGEPPLCSYMDYSADYIPNSLKLGTIYPKFVRRFYTLVEQEDLSATELDKFGDCIKLSKDGTTYFRHLLLNPDTSEDLNASENRLSFQLLKPKSIADKYKKKIRENSARFKISHL